MPCKQRRGLRAPCPHRQHLPRLRTIPLLTGPGVPGEDEEGGTGTRTAEGSSVCVHRAGLFPVGRGEPWPGAAPGSPTCCSSMLWRRRRKRRRHGTWEQLMKAALGTLKMLSIHPRAGSGVRAQHQLGTPMLPCQGGGTERDKELLCASSPWPGKPGVPRPAQWDGTALPPSHGHPEAGETRKVTDMGRGSLHPQTVGTPSALGLCRRSLTWRSTWQSRTVHLAPLPQSPLALSISGCHRRSG